MIAITFQDRATEKRALALLLGRFSGHVLKSGEHLVPKATLEALSDQNIPFTIKGTPHSPQLQAMLEAAQRRIQAGAGIPEEEFWEETERRE